MTLATRLMTLLALVLVCIARPLLAEPVTLKLSFEPDLSNAKQTYETCASCHLPEGWGNIDGAYPQIAGQHPNVLFKQLLDIRNGVRENPIMYPFVQERTIGGYKSLADVVIYISTLPMHPKHKKGPWRERTDEYKAGKTLFNKYCTSCHGSHAEGNNEALIPKLYGQHYPYTIRQIKLVENGQRKVNAAMKAIVDQLSLDQLQQILNYVSYLPVPEDKRAPSLDWRNTDLY